jgi:Tfp pilus assembly protein PilF
MTRLLRIGRGVLAVVLGLGGLAGCKLGEPYRPPSPILAPEVQSKGPLKAQQVADVRIALAQAREQQGDLQQAAIAYQDALKQDPSRGDAWIRLAVLRDRQGKFQESEELYRKALKTQPGNPAVYANMGYSLYLQGRWVEAERNLRQALALQPEDARAHNNLGLVLARTGRDDEALAEFRKAGCSEADAHSNLAFALTLERRWPDARRHYECVRRLPRRPQLCRGP